MQRVVKFFYICKAGMDWENSTLGLDCSELDGPTFSVNEQTTSRGPIDKLVAASLL